jgi:hypothetical protein
MQLSTWKVDIQSLKKVPSESVMTHRDFCNAAFDLPQFKRVELARDQTRVHESLFRESYSDKPPTASQLVEHCDHIALYHSMATWDKGRPIDYAGVGASNRWKKLQTSFWNSEQKRLIPHDTEANRTEIETCIEGFKKAIYAEEYEAPVKTGMSCCRRLHTC